MSLYVHTSYKWKTIEDVMESIKTRNRKCKIIDDNLYIKIQGKDPMLVWDSREKRNVYLSKADWRSASPAIRRIEACVILRVPPSSFFSVATSIGIYPKKGKVGQQEPVSPRYPWSYYSLDDLYDISIELERRRKNNKSPSVVEIRRLFKNGYIQYKKTRQGDVVPLWDEGIVV